MTKRKVQSRAGTVHPPKAQPKYNHVGQASLLGRALRLRSPLSVVLLSDVYNRAMAADLGKQFSAAVRANYEALRDQCKVRARRLFPERALSFKFAQGIGRSSWTLTRPVPRSSRCVSMSGTSSRIAPAALAHAHLTPVVLQAHRRGGAARDEHRKV